MTLTTSLMGLLQAQGTDNARDYLKVYLANSLASIDAHDHSSTKGAPVKRLQNGTFASRPAAGNAGHVYVANDAGRVTWDNGSAWIEAAMLANANTFTNTLTISAGGLVVTAGGLTVSAGTTLLQRVRTSGTGLITGDFALSSGWGNTATIGSIVAGSSDQRGSISIAAGGTGIAGNPTITFTFHDGAWTTPPFAQVSVVDNTGVTYPMAWGVTTTSLTITLYGTPVAGRSYTFNWSMIG